MSSRQTILIPADPTTNRYGITERKKQEIDLLTQQVLNAENEVQQYQAIVTSLTEKSTKLDAELATAETNKTQALNNKNSVDTVVNNAKSLYESSELTDAESSTAEKDIKGVATEVNTVINKLIYSAEVINKLSNLVIRKKAINPLISDELVSMVTEATTNANNAVALTLVALESVFASQATTIESKSAMALELLQAKKLYEFIMGRKVTDAEDVTNRTSLLYYLDEAYNITSNMYEETLAASDDTTGQLNAAQVSLSNSEVKLSSLQAGLAAANAAALAS
jgi:hypothetical protein